MSGGTVLMQYRQYRLQLDHRSRPDWAMRPVSIYKKSDMVPMFRMAFCLASGRTRAAGRGERGICP